MTEPDRDKPALDQPAGDTPAPSTPTQREPDPQPGANPGANPGAAPGAGAEARGSGGSGCYNDRYFGHIVDGSARSAKIVLGHLFEMYQPGSVVDFGCGSGGWLLAAGSLGASRLRGFDGPWMTKEKLLSAEIDFTSTDLDRPPALEERYDLAMSLEVAEHLRGDSAPYFVRALCAASPVVLFSAAIPGQAGTHHINEQWQSYWVKLFEAQGYGCFDVIRPAVWDNTDVEWWYRQNTFLFVDPAIEPDRLNLDELRKRVRPLLDVVHPAFYRYRTDFVRFSLGSAKRFFSHSLGGRLGGVDEMNR